MENEINEDNVVVLNNKGNTMKIKHYFSIVAGLISAAAVGYALLAPIWELQYADKVFSTGSVMVMVLSLILSVFTGEKISNNKTPQYMITSTKDGSVFNMEEPQAFSGDYELDKEGDGDTLIKKNSDEK